MATAKKPKTEIHIQSKTPRPMPPDFPQVAPLHTSSELREIYRCGSETLSRWCDESGADYKGKKRPVSIPADFRKVAPLYTKRELMEIYGRGSFTIDRWLALTGVKAKRVKAPAKKRDPLFEINVCTHCPRPVCRPSGCATLAAAYAALDAETDAGREKPGIDSIHAAAL